MPSQREEAANPTDPIATDSKAHEPGPGAVVTESGKALHSDGDDWGLRVVQKEGEKTVLLIGDSICNAYKGYLANELKSFRVVAWINPYHLGQEHLNENMLSVLQRERYDLIHFNIGLHGWAEGRIKEGQYQLLLQRYVDTLKENCSEAKMIWSSITPITSEEKPYRTNDKLDPIIYQRNQIANVVMTNGRIPINDLYTLCLLNLEKARGDNFHWTDPMYKIMAIQTASKIKESLMK